MQSADILDHQGQPANCVDPGLRSLTEDNNNNLLGKFKLTGIPAAPRGVPQIKVNDILKVSADKGTGKSESITEKGRLSQEDVGRMVRQAEEFATGNGAQKKRIESVNSLQNYVWGLKS
jgi:heat shock protein 5